VDDLPVIVEPVAIPRSRTRSERPISAGPDSHPPVSFHASASYSGGSKIGDLPNRLSGWFSHAFSSSATDLTLPSLLSQSHLAAATSPNRGKATNALLTAAKQGKGHLDKALRYLIDSDAMPDKSTAPIWLLGVQHPGYEPHAAAPSSISRRGSVDSRRAPSYRSSASSSSSHAELPPVNPANNWPPAFYADFVSRVWLTYRSQFMPIRDTTLSALEYGQEGASPQPHSATSLSSSSSVKRWPWTSGEKGWTSDAGWGCMLRTGQSLLANALIHLHLGRGAFCFFKIPLSLLTHRSRADWRRPPSPAYTPEYAMYAQILTWFFDTPAPAAPFSVHRMALAGKDLGTEVGQWFGPSVAAGALKRVIPFFFFFLWW
jgi:cysteine protease ATG4